jgi:arsenate reductase (thioredoxin)
LPISPETNQPSTPAALNPADQLNPSAVAAMAEKGIDIATEQPKRWTNDMLDAADAVVTTGCSDTCPVLPGRV